MIANATLKLLVVEDHPGDFLVIEQMLKSVREPSWEITHAADANAALTFMQVKPFDLILLDLMLPDCQGLDTFRKVYTAARDIPILILSGVKDNELALTAVREGAQDYLMKSEFDERLLIKSIYYSIERYKISLQLAKSKAHFQHLFAQNPSPTLIWDLKTQQILQSNKAAQQLYGFTSDELSQCFITSFFVKADDAPLPDMQNNSFIAQCKQKTKSGTEIILDVQLLRIELEMEAVGMMMAVDCTMLVKQNQDIALQAEMMQHLQEPIFVTDGQQKITFWNQAASRLLGYNQETMLGQTPYLLVSQIDQQDLMQYLQSNRQEAFKKQRFNFISSQMELRHVEINSSKLQSYQAGWLHVVRDLTDVTQTIETQSEMMATLNSLFNHVSDGILLLDMQCRIKTFNQTANKQAVQLLGKNLKAGMPFAQMLLPEMQPEVMQLFANIEQDKQSRQMEVAFAFAENRKYWFLLSVAAMQDEHQQNIGFCVLMQNISQRKHDEIKLARQYREMEKTNRELDRFIYSASHDLKAPLNSILGLINLSRSETKDDNQLQYLQMMEKGVNRLSGFINDFLNYSRNNRTEPAAQTIQLGLLLGEIIEQLKYSDTSGKIAFTVENKVNTPIVSDETRLKMILGNLLSNAIRYHNTEQSHPWVRISAEYKDNHLELQVIDNGPGIPLDKQDKLFDMFYRASDKPGGTGLGLFIVKEAVEKLQGSIELKSAPGQGCNFVIHLPLGAN